MAELLPVYHCEKCGNIVEMVHAGRGTLTCCGQATTLLTENTTDAAKEKHVPVVEKTDTGYKVTVGSVAHPMEEKHYIEWIELLADGKSYRQFLAPDQKPETVFDIAVGQATARAFCNLHGLWKG